jgi:type IV pilus assembly protein PilM
MDCQFFPDLAVWFGDLKQQWAETHIAEDAAAEQKGPQPPEAADKPADGEQPAVAPDATAGEAAGGSETAGGETKEAVTGPTGPGWVIELRGHHFHNEPRHKPLEGAQFLRSTLVKNLMGRDVKVTVSAGPLAGQQVSLSELGIGFPIIVESSRIKSVRIPVANISEGSGRPTGGMPMRPGAEPTQPLEPQDLLLKRYDFVLQLCWQPRPAGQAPPPPAAPAAVQ